MRDPWPSCFMEANDLNPDKTATLEHKQTRGAEGKGQDWQAKG